MVKDLKKSIGLLGGSFDPAHNGHLKLSKIALRKMRLNKVMWIVSKKNPFKNKPLYSLKQRIKKAREVALNEKKIQVCSNWNGHPGPKKSKCRYQKFCWVC